MSGTLFYRGLGAGLLIVAMAVAGPALAQAAFNVDVPAQGLADALREVGRQTSTNIIFEPLVVQGMKVSALRAKLTSDEAIAALLKGTGLSAQRTSADTVVVKRATAPTSLGGPPATNDQAPSKTTGLIGSRRSSEDPFRVAQVDQTTAGPQVEERKAEEKKYVLEEVLVTGTHIHGDTAPSSPVITITSEDIARSGYTSIGDVLRSLPQSFGGGNSPQVQTGAAPGHDNYAPSYGSAPNLRGLGPASTLTLVNGRRLAQDAQSGAVDVTLIPLDAIERVEVVTDGASAIYGADAVAGVVNIILKDHFDGGQTSATVGKATDGGALEKRFSQLLGQSWQSGSALLTYERDMQGAVSASQRRFTTSSFLPYDLLPQTSRDSFVGTLRERPTDAVSLFVDALYTSRTASTVVTHFAPNSLGSVVDVKEYQGTGGITVSLPAAWSATAFASFASDKSLTDSSYFTPSTPGGTPITSETVRGTSRTFEAHADGPLVSLPAGPIRLAIGGGYRHETFDDVDALIPPPAFSSGTRNVGYGFGELAFPIIAPESDTFVRRLDINASGRFERYSDFGSKAVPKIGIVLVPIDSLKARGSWNKSFRAPSLADVYGSIYSEIDALPDPLSPTGTSNVLSSGGGNPNLGPETAASWTGGLEYSPEWVRELQISATYFNITYTNRISTIPSVFTALTDPANAPFVTRSPSPQAIAALINAPAGCYNSITGVNCTLSDPVNVIVDGAPVNVARQRINGVDLGVDKKNEFAPGAVDVFLNATYLEVRNQLTAGSPEIELAGASFEPAKFRARGGATWSSGRWSATAVVNYLGPEVNTYQPTQPHVSSWTTADAQIAFHSGQVGIFRDLQASLSVQNIFDRDPPYLVFDFYRTGLHYDNLNASPLGRFISLRLAATY